MNPQTAWKLVKLVPFALAIALVGCGDDSSSGTTPTDPVPDTVPPGVPTNISVDQDGSLLVVQWDENAEPDLAGYVLQRSVDRGTTWESVSSYLIASATWSDTFHNRAEYRVLAEDTAANQSAYSNQALWVVTTGGGKYATDSAQPIL